jgi:nucleoside 2-deoxyribosyltransferase
LRVFLAAPLFSEGERDFNRKVAEALRARGYTVWMAQEAEEPHPLTSQDKRRIFEMDLNALSESEVVVAILDGVEVDSGVCFELGYAYAQGKPIIGLKTDHRVFSPTEPVNLMIESALVTLAKSLEEVVAALDRLRERQNAK